MLPPSLWSGVFQSVERLAMGWMVRGSNPGEARFSALVQTGPGAHPASYTKGNETFPRIKRPGRGGDHPELPSAEVKEGQELYL
jgi:hypothetical protein